MAQSPNHLAEADRLLQQAIEQCDANPQVALQALQQALSIWRDGSRKAFSRESRERQGAILNRMGDAYVRLRQYPQALESYQQALDIAKEVGDRAAKAVAFSSIGAAYQELGRYSQALSSYQQALEAAKSIGDRSEEGRLLNKLGEILSQLGQQPQARDYYQKALAIAKEVGDREEEGRILAAIRAVPDNLTQPPPASGYGQPPSSTRQAEADRLLQQAWEQYQTCQFQSAMQSSQSALEIYHEIGNHYYQQALSILQAVDDRAGEGATLNNIGLVYSNLGQYRQALEQYQQALPITRAISDRVLEGATLNNIGLVYSNLGQYAQALEQFQQALVIAREIGDRALEGATLNNIGEVYSSLGQYRLALEQFQQALAIRGEIGDRAGEGAILNNIGLVYSNLGQYRQALEQFQQALTIAREVGDRAGEGITLNNIGTVYGHLGQYRQALEEYQQALAIRGEIGDRAGEGITLGNIGLAQLWSGQVAAATQTLFNAIEVQDTLRAPALSDANKISLFDRQTSAYDLLQQVLIAQNQLEAALEVSERGRARAFVDLLSHRVSPETTAHSTAVSAPTLAQVKQIAQEQNATLVQYSIAYGPSQEEGKPQWRPSHLYIWVIKPTGEIAFRSIDLSTYDTSLSTLIALSREAIGIRARGYSIPVKPISRQPAQAKLQLQKLYQILIAPIADLLPVHSSERIVFIPQEELFLVPFAALQDTQGRYLIQTHTILTALSVQVLGLTHQLQQDRAIDFSKALIVGNPTMPALPTLSPSEQPLPSLPRAEQEAIAIAQLLQTQPLIGDEATETTIVQRMAEASVIHLATHGLLEYGNPQASGVRDLPGAIVLAHSNQDDGLLTSSEILNLKLHANLVVLSACDTGRGDITGDGVIGLSRALIGAGASSVMVSLWKVADESTERLMVEFYRQLQHTDKAQALRQAMLKTMHQYPDPFDWAAFTLVGEAE
jgi:CHAT domain-containing protein/Tfp pilus assembly protein PilF